jgi:hypothetical protein
MPIFAFLAFVLVAQLIRLIFFAIKSQVQSGNWKPIYGMITFTGGE